MSDATVFDHINALSTEEEDLYASASEGQGLTAEATERLEEIRSSSTAATTCSTNDRPAAPRASTRTRRSSGRSRLSSATSSDRCRPRRR